VICHSEWGLHPLRNPPFSSAVGRFLVTLAPRNDKILGFLPNPQVSIDETLRFLPSCDPISHPGLGGQRPIFMSTMQNIQRFFAYDDWANHEVLRSLEALPGPPQRSVKLLAHILSARRLWLERLLAQKQTYPVWPDFTMGQCKSEAAELPALWKKYLTALKEDELSQSLTYKNTKGESWTSQKQDILMHVVMHSTYHRGQIAADIRAAGFTPPYTDFIHGVRQGFVE